VQRGVEVQGATLSGHRSVGAGVVPEGQHIVRADRASRQDREGAPYGIRTVLQP
jgi:hypothetical protein